MMTRADDQINQMTVDNYKGGIFSPIQNVGNLASGYGPFKTFAKKVQVKLISDNPAPVGAIWSEPFAGGLYALYFPPYATYPYPPYGTMSQQADFFDYTEVEMTPSTEFSISGSYYSQTFYQSNGFTRKTYPASSGNLIMYPISYLDVAVSISTVFGLDQYSQNLPVPNSYGFNRYEILVQMRFSYKLTDGADYTNRSVMDLRTRLYSYDWPFEDNFPAWGSKGERLLTGTSYWTYQRYGTHNNVDYTFADYFQSATTMKIKWDDTV